MSVKGIRIRQKPEVALRVMEVLERDPFLGKALVLGHKVLMDREYARFEELVRSGRVGEAGAFALAVARSPYAYKFPNREAPRGGWKELAPVIEALMGTGDLKAVEGAIRLKTEGDEAEAAFLLELLAAGGDLRGAVLALAGHLPQDRRHRASEVQPPFPPYLKAGKEVEKEAVNG